MGLSDTGIVRSKNEDAIGYDSALGLIVLADGMGGHRGGRNRQQHDRRHRHRKAAAKPAAGQYR